MNVVNGPAERAVKLTADFVGAARGEEHFTSCRGEPQGAAKFEKKNIEYMNSIVTILF